MTRPKRTSESVAGRPRSLQEMDFVAGMRPCKTCGDHSDRQWENLRSDTLWLTSATCAACGTEGVYVFSNTEDLTEVAPPELELGAGASTVVDAKALRAEIERLGPIDGPDFDWDHMERLQITYNELAKLAPSPRVDEERSRLAKLVRDRLARKERDPVAPIEPAEPVAPRGSLDRAAQEAHWDWCRRGRTGAGRFDVAHRSLPRSRLDGVKAAGGRFEAVDLRGSNLDLADWSEVEFVRCDLAHSSAYSTRFCAAVIVDTTFDDCRGARLVLERANVYGASFARATLDGAWFMDAVIASTNFAAAVFGNARWDRARLQRCNFRGASFEPSRDLPPATLRGTVFEDCDLRDADFAGADLRGATFERCRFAGARGVPRHFAPAAVVACDTDATALFAQLVPALDARALAAHADRLLVADDRDPGASGLAVFEFVGKRVRLIGRTTEAEVGVLVARGAMPPARGTTCGTSGFVWLCGDTFRVHCREGMPIEVSRTELAMAGVPSPVANVTSITLLHDPDRRGRRGVVAMTPAAKPNLLAIVQEDDWIASDDPHYPDAALRSEAAWAPLLARDLAAWLGVPFAPEASCR